MGLWVELFLLLRGLCGGVFVMWDTREMENLEECIGEYSAACLFKNVEDGFEWAFVGTYGPNSDGTRRLVRDRGICPGAFEGISMLPNFLVRDWGSIV